MKIIKLPEAESRMMFGCQRQRGVGNEEMLVREYKVSIKMNEFWRSDVQRGDDIVNNTVV